jgi:DNA-binding MarR family transcriptional regulator/GNAT superfamily N-acetyltransferase
MATNTRDHRDQVTAVRAFNRFWTQQIGVLQAGLLDTPYSLTEARVLFELAQAERTDQADLRRELGLDAGYLTRIVARLKGDGLVTAERSTGDGRRQVIRLTTQGREVFHDMDTRSSEVTARMLGDLPEAERSRLVSAMATIEATLAPPAAAPPRAWVLREPRAGELGWVVARHGAVYAAEYGWDQTFEAMVARVVADFGERRDRERERAWIAEVDGAPAGCVMCVRYDDDRAQLRVLLVEPAARGLGIGRRLVDECVRFARGAGYGAIVLWTNSVLESARRIYEAAGFTLVDEGRHDAYGHDVVDQAWRLDLR